MFCFLENILITFLIQIFITFTLSEKQVIYTEEYITSKKLTNVIIIRGVIVVGQRVVVFAS